MSNEIPSILSTRRWLLVAPALLLWWIIGQIDKSNISLVIIDPAFLAQLNLHGRYSELGGLLSAFFAGYGISIFAWGFLVDRFGARACLVAGTLAWGLMMFLMSKAASFEEMIAARFLLGVAEGNMWPVSNLLTNRWFPVKEHSRAQAFWMMGPTLGTALGVPLVSSLIMLSGWSGMMHALALISFLPLVAFLFIPNSPREQVEADEHERRTATRGIAASSRSQDLGALLVNRAFWLITAGMIISGATMFTLVQWTPSFLVEQRGLSPQAMSLHLTVGYLIATALTSVFGAVGDRTMKRALTAMGASLFMAFLILPAAMLFRSELSAIALAALIAVPCVIAALNGALLHGMVQPHIVARSTGIYSGVGGIVAAIGPWAFGKLIGALGGEYWGGFLFIGLLNLLGALVYIFLHRAATRGEAKLQEELIGVVPD